MASALSHLHRILGDRAYRFMAVHDGNGMFAAAAEKLETSGFRAPERILLRILEEPRLGEDLPEPAPLPDNYRRIFPGSRLVRIHRGKVSGGSPDIAQRRGKRRTRGHPE